MPKKSNKRAQIQSEKEIGEISIYPNPSNSYFELKFYETKADRINIEVTDMYGKQVFRDVEPMVINDRYRLDVSDLSSGIYYVNIYTDNEKYIMKIVICR